MDEAQTDLGSSPARLPSWTGPPPTLPDGRAGPPVRVHRRLGALALATLLVLSLLVLGAPARTGAAGSTPKALPPPPPALQEVRAPAPPARADHLSALPGTVNASTDDARLHGNTLLETQIAVPHGPWVTSDLSIWLEQPITASVVGAVGLRVQGSPAGPSAWGAFAVYDSGVLTTLVVNRSGSFAPGTVVTLALAETQGSWWTFTAQGVRIQSTGQNGTLDLGASSAAAIVPGELPVSEPTLSASSDGNATFPPLTSPLVFGGWLGGTWLSPGEGTSTSSGGAWGVQGSNQNASLASDSLEMNGSWSPTPSGTYLWGVGGLGYGTLASWTSSSPSALAGRSSSMSVELPASNGAGGGSQGDFCAVLDEPLDHGVVLGVGACWRSELGIAVDFLSYEGPGGGYQTTPNGPPPAPGTTPTLAWSSLGGGYWQATLNGIVLSVPGTNGTIYGGSVLANGTVAPTGEVWGGGPGGATASEVDLPVALAISASPGLSSGPVPFGSSGPGTSSADLLGNAQDWSVAPGSLRVLLAGPSTPAGTVLWNLTSNPGVVLSVHGWNASVSSSQPFQLYVWANLSGGGAANPSELLWQTFPSTSVTPEVLGPGAWTLRLVAPIYGPNVTKLALNLTAAAPGRAPSSLNETAAVLPGDLVAAVTSPVGSSLPDDAPTPLTFYLNATDPSGGPTSPVTGSSLTLAASAGGNLSALTPAGPGTFTGTFSPVLVPNVVHDRLVGSASAPGFYPLAVGLTFLLVPGPLSLSVTNESARLPTGANVTVVAWVNATSGPLTSAALSATLVGGATPSGDLVRSVGALRPDGGRNVTLALPIEPSTTVGTLSWTANAFGHSPASRSYPVQVEVADLAVLFAPVPPLAAGTLSQAIPFQATGANSTPLSGVEVTLALPSGAGSLAQGVARTTADGSGTFEWYPPPSAGTWQVTFRANLVGYASVSGGFNLTVRPASSSGGPWGGPWTEVAIGAAAVASLLVLFLLVGQHRWRARSGKEEGGGRRRSPSRSRPARSKEPPRAPSAPARGPEGEGKTAATTTDPAGGTSGDAGPGSGS